MGDLGDVALDAPEEKEEERGKIDVDEHGRNEDVLHVHVQIQVRLVGGGRYPPPYFSFPISCCHFTLCIMNYTYGK